MAGDLVALQREDGSVIVPAAIAGEVLRLLVRVMTDDARRYGGQPSPAARELLSALYEAARPQPDDEPDPTAPAGAAVITVTEMAERMGCSTRWVRALLAAGRLPGHRTAGVWLVHVPAVPTSEANRDAA